MVLTSMDNLCFMLLPLFLRIARLCMAASIFDDCDLIWFNPFIDLLFLAGMTSPAPPNTRQVRLQLLISVFYLRSFERVAFKSGYSINKLPHCKAWINMQQQKIPTSQNYSGWIPIAASLFVFVSLVPWSGAPLIFVTFPFWIINALEIRSDTECNKSSFTLLCRTSEEKVSIGGARPWQ